MRASTATPLAGSTASPTAEEQTATTDLLTPKGIRTAIAAIVKETGRDRFGDLTVYPEHVSADVMVKGSNTAYDSYTYRPGQGVQEDISKGTLTGEEKPVRLDGFDWDKVPSLLAQAKKKLKVPKANTRYLVLDVPGNGFGFPVGMRIYLSNDYSQTGYLVADKKGRINTVMPADS